MYLDFLGLMGSQIELYSLGISYFVSVPNVYLTR